MIQKKLNKDKTVFIFRLVLLSLIIGIICGAVGSLFAKSITFATEMRHNHGWILYLLPFGGLVSVALYKLCKTEGMGTKDAFRSALGDDCLKPSLLASIFSGTVISHLFGASSGREGAALQIGAVISSAVSKKLRLDNNSRRILTVCGMGAVFSALFGTPLGACVFAVEALRNGRQALRSFIPALISSITAYSVARISGIPAERFYLNNVPDFSFSLIWRVALVALAVSIVGFLFCHILHFSESNAEKLIKNPYIRISLGGIIIVILTLLADNNDYNGGGIFVIERIFESNEVYPFAFILKILFTVISVASGFRGGEIVPSLFIGATAGGALSAITGIPVSLGAATGMASILGSVTKCPVAVCILCAEMFGIDGLFFFIISAITGTFTSGKVSLFRKREVMVIK